MLVIRESDAGDEILSSVGAGGGSFGAMPHAVGIGLFNPDYSPTT